MTLAPHQTSLHIQGMTCGSCTARVDKALRGVPGVLDAAVNLTTGMASVQGTAAETDLLTAVDHAGYSAKILADSSAQTLSYLSTENDRHVQTLKLRIIIGAAVGLPVVLIDLFEMQIIRSSGTPGETINSLALFLATIVMATCGLPFFRGALKALRHRSVNMDVLVALGTGVAFLYSSILITLQGARLIPLHKYHNELHAAVTIVVLITLGKYLEARAKRLASSAVAHLATQTAATATRLRDDGTLETIPAEQIAIGDRLQILAHQQLPVDGIPIEGTGTIDLSIITGESVPVDIQIENQKSKIENLLPGGATLADGRIILRATSTAAASTVARILHLVNTAQASKTQIQGLADRIAAIFVPIVLLLAAANFTGWLLFTGDWQRALLTTIATIVIACPCAMGLATPTAITVAMGSAAKLGILFTQARALETARTITTVIFDKTGTLTTGKFKVQAFLSAKQLQLNQGQNSEMQGSEAMLQILASLEQFSEHPLAKAISLYAESRNCPRLDLDAFSSIPGGGIKGTLRGTEYAAGSYRFMQTLGGISDEYLSPLTDFQRDGGTLVGLMQTNPPSLLAVMCFRDELRPDARETIRILKNDMGMNVVMLTGDIPSAARRLGDELGISWTADTRPEQKVQAIRELQNPATVQEVLKKTPIQGRKSRKFVAFIGDGINDAPALAAADLGIALATGTDLAKSAGDVLLTSPRFTAIPQTLALSRRTLRIIKQNLFWAFAYNIAAIPLAMFAILPPGAAAGAMMLSSLTVVGNALRLRKT